MQMTQEINIHRSVGHKHIVGFHGFFEDNDNVYILLELCRRRVRTEFVSLLFVQFFHYCILRKFYPVVNT